MIQKQGYEYRVCVDCKNTWNVCKQKHNGRYICPHCVERRRNETKKKKPNFWTLLPKLSIVTASVFAVYIAHREYTGTGNITGLSAVVPLAIVVYYVITQAVECVFEGKRKD